MTKSVDSINSVEELVKELDTINRDWFKLTKWYGLSMTVFDNDMPEVKRVADACSNLLVNADGTVNSTAADIIRSKGYSVVVFGGSGIITCKSGMHSELRYGDNHHTKREDKTTVTAQTEDKTAATSQTVELKFPTIENLVSMLDSIYARKDELIKNSEDNDGKQFFDFDNDEVSKVIAKCNAFLIGENGSCNWNSIDHLRNQGYRVYAGESDSFGWLTGCIEKCGSNTVLVYG